MDLRILDLDGGLTVQPSLRRQRPAVVPCQGWGPRIRLGCSFGRFRRFERSLALRLGTEDAPPLTFIGSGDFHHVSLALVRRVRGPFNLLVIDNHPDWMRRIPFLHCGTWLWHASRLPNLRRIFHAGGDVDFDNRFRHLAPRAALKSGRVVVLPAVRRYRRGVWRVVPHTPLRENPDEPLTAGRLDELLRPHFADLAGCPLYVSLDKDVMTAADAVVNWDSGHLGLAEVRTLLHGFIHAAGARLAGMDVTGDWSTVTVRGWLRRFFHMTEHPALEVAPHEALTLNDRANQFLLETLAAAGVYSVAVSRRAAS